MLSFVLAFVDLCLLPTFAQNIYFHTTMRPPPRKRDAVIFYDDKKAKGEEAVEKKRSETAKKRRTNALEPVPVEPLPKLLHQASKDPLPTFQPPFRIDYEAFQSPFDQRSPLNTFLLFFTIAVLDCVVENTNSYASNWRPQPLQKYCRTWYPLTRHELLRYIGLLFYMGRHSEPNRDDYWKVSSHNLGRYMIREWRRNC
jgi:hypothetical protein